MKILITGSSGFIGSALKKLLTEKNIEVVTCDIKDNSSDDVRDFQVMKTKIKDVDGVIHLAAVSRVKIAYQKPLSCVNTNIGGISNILEAVRVYNHNGDNKRPWIIFASSREVYGEPDVLPVTEKTPMKPMNVYGISKVTGEKLCESFSKYYNLKIRTLRFCNVYSGKHDQLDRVIPKFIIQAIKNEDLTINGVGQEIFDFTYIQDTLQGIWGCIEEIEKNNNLYDDFILSSGEPASLKELAEMIIEMTKSKSKIQYAPARSYDVNKFYANAEKAKKILGFHPVMKLKKGLGLVIEELKKENSK